MDFFKARFNPTCGNCGEVNSPKHVTNNCSAFNKLRMRAWKQLDEVIKSRINKKDRYNGDLEKASWMLLQALS
jgi:ribosomal protein L32